MPQLTEAEIKLHKKYEELRKKREKQTKQKSSADPVTSGGGILLTAKAAQPKKTTAAKPSATPADTPPSASPTLVDPLTAAKRALEAKKRSGPKKAVQKRPTVQRVAKPNEMRDARNLDGSASPAQLFLGQLQELGKLDAIPEGVARCQKAKLGDSMQEPANHDRKRKDAGASTAWDWDQQETKRHRSEADAERPQPKHSSRDSTLFVGDLPPFYNNADVLELFSGFGPVEDVKVIKAQCYAFVTFKSVEAAQQLLKRFTQRPLTAHGHTLRINQAYGQMPEWKNGPATFRRRPEGVEAPHPKVAEARDYGDHLADQLLRAGTHGLDLSGKPQPRQLVTYNDL